jgi:uncharacterized protein (TIGR02246 family)
LALQIAFFPAGALAAGAEDEKLIRDVTARWEEAWNQHDMKAGAALFAEEADFINVNGTLWHGRAAIEQSHNEMHAGIFKTSTFKTISVDVRFLAPEIARTHVKWEISGDTNRDGTARPPRQGIFTQILTKKDGRWLITVWHNTNIIVPR